MLGYQKGADGKPEINPEQADTLKWIFAAFLAGYSISAIKKELERRDIPSPSGKKEWSQSVIQYALSNERYIGDVLLQKTYVVDCISKQIKKNNGEIPQYYIRDNHPGIIDRGIFQRVQEELARRSAKRRVSDKALTEKGKYSSKYALSELLTCNECGTRYRRVTWARNGKKKIVWRCINRLENGTKHCQNSPTLEETLLHDAILRTVNQILGIREEVLESLAETAGSFTRPKHSDFDRLSAQQKVAELEETASQILQLIHSTEAGTNYFE